MTHWLPSLLTGGNWIICTAMLTIDANWPPYFPPQPSLPGEKTVVLTFDIW